ncbi:MAG: M23 family metallopeptidase [Friedmanniella sp.]
MSRTARRPALDPVVLSVPLTGSCRVQNSPANRVPSHGTEAFGSSYAIDLVPVDDRGRSAPPTRRGLLKPEPPELFVGFGLPILAPVAGTVAVVHDGEPDHEARRSQLALVPYLLGQSRRAKRGAAGLAGNHVVIAIGTDGPYLLLAHLQRGSVQVRPGQPVSVGIPVGRCGNSGNSTEPHLHLQVSDSTDWPRARGLPFIFRRQDGSTWLPANSEIVRS